MRDMATFELMPWGILQEISLIYLFDSESHKKYQTDAGSYYLNPY